MCGGTRILIIGIMSQVSYHYTALEQGMFQ